MHNVNEPFCCLVSLKMYFGCKNLSFSNSNIPNCFIANQDLLKCCQLLNWHSSQPINAQLSQIAIYFEGIGLGLKCQGIGEFELYQWVILIYLNRQHVIGLTSHRK